MDESTGVDHPLTGHTSVDHQEATKLCALSGSKPERTLPMTLTPSHLQDNASANDGAATSTSHEDAPSPLNGNDNPATLPQPSAPQADGFHPLTDSC